MQCDEMKSVTDELGVGALTTPIFVAELTPFGAEVDRDACIDPLLPMPTRTRTPPITIRRMTHQVNTLELEGLEQTPLRRL